jgi:hypothetical protein
MNRKAVTIRNTLNNRAVQAFSGRKIFLEEGDGA